MLKLSDEYIEFIMFSSFPILLDIPNGIQNTNYICYMKLEDHEAIHAEFSVKNYVFKLQFCTQNF